MKKCGKALFLCTVKKKMLRNAFLALGGLFLGGALVGERGWDTDFLGSKMHVGGIKYIR